jgi:hypothetical protein
MMCVSIQPKRTTAPLEILGSELRGADDIRSANAASNVHRPAWFSSTMNSTGVLTPAMTVTLFLVPVFVLDPAHRAMGTAYLMHAGRTPPPTVR